MATESRRRLGALLLVGLVLPGLEYAQEPAETLQSPAERATETPAGPLQGRWRLLRIDPSLHTRAASEALLLEVIDDPVAARIELQWLAGRAICEAPLEEPCDWVGSSGQASEVVTQGGGLLAVLPLSAEQGDPMLLWLPALPGTGWMFNALGGFRYRVEAERLPTP